MIGIRYALERGRDGQPVGTALVGMATAVAALCATAVFGTSLAHLISSPALYGAPFQAYFAGDGTPGSQSVVTGPLLDSLKKDRAIEQITLGDFVEINVNGSHVRTVAVTPLRGPALLSAVDGRLPGGDRDIMLGAATMRATKARLGGTVRVTITDPTGTPHEASFRVIGRASLNAGAGGLGHGAVITTSAFIGAQCPPGGGHSACANAVRKGMAAAAVLVRAAPGAAGSAALARHIRKYPSLTYRPVKPTVLVNFGESVNFPLLLGVALSLFGIATLVHLLLVSVVRRRVETGLLKALGFVGRQVAAVVCWQATAVSADRNRDRGAAGHRGGKGVLAGVRHELRRRAGRCGRAAADGGAGGGGARRRHRGGRGSRAAGRAITSGPAAQGRVSGWSGKPWSGSQGAGGSLGAGRYRPRAERGG